jgi:hypothetical protein
LAKNGPLSARCYRAAKKPGAVIRPGVMRSFG